MTTREADSLFSRLILERDKVCQRCGARTGLTCSHYWNRWRAATRFDKDNCVSLCIRCHRIWEYAKRSVTHEVAEYREFMIKRLGQEKFEELARRSETFMKMRDAVEAFMKS